MVSRRLITTALILIFLGMNLLSRGVPLSVAADPGGAAREKGMPAPQMKIAIHNGLLSLDVRDTEIGEILRAVAEKTGIALTVGEGVGGKVSLVLEGVSLEEALRQLCASRAIIYEYDAKTRIGRIIGAGAFASASVPAAGSQSTVAIPLPAKAAAEIPPPQSGSPSGTGGGERIYDSQGRLLYKPRELLVRFRPEAMEAQITALHLSLGSTVLKRNDPLKLYRVRLRDGLPETEAVKLYRASEIVASVERHALRYPMKTPNDPYYDAPDLGRVQWGMKAIHMPEAWDLTIGSPSVTVAVIDTGVDYLHPDLVANIWTNPSEIPGNKKDDDNNGYIDDVHGWDFAGSGSTNGDNDPMDPANPPLPAPVGHGTHVAGIISAVGNNGIGVAGVGWALRVMPLKVMADNASEILVADIVEAIDYAIARGVRVVNCSFGGEAPSDQLEYDAFVRLRQAGILAVCAAGNYGRDNDGPSPIYPASYDLNNIISVAASDQQDRLWSSSNYGKQSVDLMAPGQSIRSTKACSWGCLTAECAATTCSSVDYPEKSGTSFSAPHVAGVAGLIFSLRPKLGYAVVKSILLENVDRIAAVSDQLVAGGRLNAAKALSQTCYPGEVTGKNGIGLDDVILALRIASRMDATDYVCRTADVDGDDGIGLAEAIYDLQVLAGLRE